MYTINMTTNVVLSNVLDLNPVRESEKHRTSLWTYQTSLTWTQLCHIPMTVPHAIPRGHHSYCFCLYVKQNFVENKKRMPTSQTQLLQDAAKLAEIAFVSIFTLQWTCRSIIVYGCHCRWTMHKWRIFVVIHSMHSSLHLLRVGRKYSVSFLLPLSMPFLFATGTLPDLPIRFYCCCCVCDIVRVQWVYTKWH